MRGSLTFLLAASALLCATTAWADDYRPPTKPREPELEARGGDDDREEDFVVDLQGNLYKIDCVSLRTRKLGRVTVPAKDGRPVETPVLCDLGATADGYLYGISGTSLYLINLTDPSKSIRLGDHGLSGPYGMAAVGSSLLVNTNGGSVYLLDRKTGKPTKLGDMGASWSASGDIAFFGDKVLSSVKDSNGTEHLVELDPQTGKARKVGVFRDGNGNEVPNVFGLIDRKGVLYGVTSGGDLYRIDPKTARCTLLKRTGKQWWGATSYTRI